MRYMLATEVLKEEHEIILRMLRILNVISVRLKEDKIVDVNVFTRILDFIKNFVDKCHHSKEENVLFPVLEAHGIPKKEGPIGVMLIEHEYGRKYIKALTDAVERYYGGEKKAKQEIIDNITNYVNLLSQHIMKENEILFPMGNEVLHEHESAELIERFERIEMEEIGLRKHQEYIRLINDLESAFLYTSS
ncbi:MAG: hemerythrin domain-containing protein [Thermoprotei archaeon]